MVYKTIAFYDNNDDVAVVLIIQIAKRKDKKDGRRIKSDIISIINMEIVFNQTFQIPTPILSCLSGIT